jgi:hypothetical protein
MNKAKEITKQRLRYDRAHLLEELDVQFQRAIETQSDTTAIVAEKQRLRDITLLADQANSLDELKNINCTSELCSGLSNSGFCPR